MQTRPAGASTGWWSGSFSSSCRKLIAGRIRLARKFDAPWFSQHCIDGNAGFIDNLVPQCTRAGAVVYDLGGGKKRWAAGIHHGAVGGDIACVWTVERYEAPGLALSYLAAWSCSAVLCGVNACHRHGSLFTPPFAAPEGAECNN
ncbi:MAG: hypothetical protein ABSF62_22670 [Bryobacteraceae bacterium]